MTDAETSVRFLDKWALVSVAEAWRGVHANMLRVHIDNSDCTYPLQRGASYLVFAGRSTQGGPYAGLCFRTTPLEAAGASLRALGPPQSAPSTDVANPLLQGTPAKRRR
jgi:hypothetical protein